MIVYECKYCDYKSTKKSNFNKHIATQKHKHLVRNNNKKICKKSNENFTCNVIVINNLYQNHKMGYNIK